MCAQVRVPVHVLVRVRVSGSIRITHRPGVQVRVRQVIEALDKYAKQVREMDDKVTKLSDDVRRRLERLLAEGDEQANRYILDGEALQMENGRRLWDFFYVDQVVGNTNFAANPEVVQVMSRIASDTGEDGYVKLRSMFDELVNFVDRNLSDELLGDNLAKDKSKRDGLTIARALELEVHYRALFTSNQEEIQRDGQRAVSRLVSGYRSRPDNEIDLTSDLHADYMRDKIKRLVKERADYLCRYDESRDQQGGVRPDKVYLCAIREDFAGSGSAIKDAIMRANKGFKLVTNNWTSPREIVFYQAVLNVPLYVFGRMDELRDHYRRFRNMAKRAKVLHIDKNWENTLSDLDPVSAAVAHRRVQLRANIMQFAALLTLGDGGAVAAPPEAPKGSGSPQRGLKIGAGGFITRRNGEYQMRDPSKSELAEEDWTGLSPYISDAVERLPKALASEPLKYQKYQRMLQVIRSGASPTVMRLIVELPFQWRKNVDSLRQTYGSAPTETQLLKLGDYADAYERLTEALLNLRDTLQDQNMERQTLGVDEGQQTYGLDAKEFADLVTQTVAVLSEFETDWNEITQPSSGNSAMESMRWLFSAVGDDKGSSAK